MFTCLWQLWDWIESPPLFTTATMESKKLQQLQQANSHLAPQPMPLKNAPPSFHSSTGDYRPTLHSPVFQNNSPQYRSVTSQFSQLNLSTGGSQHHQQQYSIQSPQSSSGGSQSIPIDTAPSQSHHSLLMKSAQNAYNQQKQQQQHQQQLYDSQYSSSSGALTEQLYQSPSDKMYPMSMPASSSTRNPFQSPTMSYSGHPNPAISFQQQYQQLQQAKMQAQIQTQNEALVQQQRTFALRQQLNPPIPHYHLHSQSQSLASIPMQAGLQQQHEQQQHSPIQTAHRNNPPSTLNLSSQYQPAQKPLKLTNFEKQQQQEVHPRDSHYHQEISMMENKLQQEQQYVSKLMNQNYCHQQGQHYSESMQQQNKTYQEKFDTGTPSDHGPVYIQQNHPGHVVNQACQTQISGTSGSSKTKMSPESDQQQHQQNQRSPIHQQLDRKKSSGSIQALKSPITKRPASSPVTLSGWLYKQGSDGLKVWRKRWFVLSEYCLYYYKGPEEEKVLGSILLPSYKVTSCLPEDKIYRKYAFKCEHTNMRTYWLAAENSEQMCQWVRALTAAAMMQGSSESDQTSQPSVSSLNHSGENSDSGIHTFQSQQSKMGALLQGPVTPASDNGNLNNMGIGLGGCVVNNNAANFNNNTSGAQPLYANAPPKPRRINDGGYSSPSPENSIDRCDPNTESRHHLSSQYVKQPPIKSPSIPAQMKSQHHAIYDTRTGNVTSTLKHPNDSLPSSYHKQDQLNYDRNLTVSACLAQTRPPYQSSNDLLMRAGSQHFDEDLYGERELYGQQLKQQQSQRDLIMQKKYPSSHHIPGSSGYPGIASERRTPDAYGRSKSEQIQSPFSDYEDIYNLSQNKMQQQSDVCGYRRPISPQTYNNEKHVPPMPSHYNPNNLESSSTNPQVNMRTRSLQSSNLIRPHSADFLEYEARAEAAAAAVANVRSDSMRAPRPKSSLDINRAPDSYYYSEASYAEKMRQSASYLQKPQNQQQGLSTNNHRSSSNILNSSNNSGTLQDLNIYSTSGMYTIGHDTAYERMRHSESGGLTTTDQSAFSVPRMSRSHSKDFRLRQQQQQQQHQQSDQFLRSASARWPRKDEEALLKDGEKKREESMKRLLEWKQRMLQSPLTRKGAASQQYQQNLSISKLALSTNAPGGSASNLLSPYVGGGIQRSRSETHANIATGYNSYSSDDEDGPESSPAGRSSPSPSTSSKNAKDIKNQTMNRNIRKTNAKQNVIIKNNNDKNPTVNIESHVKDNNVDENHKNNSNKTMKNLNSVNEDNNCKDIANVMVSENVTNLEISSLKSMKQYVPVYVQKTSLENKTSSDLIEMKRTSSTLGINIENKEQDMKIQNDNVNSKEIDSIAGQDSVNISKESKIGDISGDTEEEDKTKSNFNTNEENDETCNEYTDNDLDEALADDNQKESMKSQSQNNDIDNEERDMETKLEDNLENTEQLYENQPKTLSAPSESHYLPMTPRRSILSPATSLAYLNPPPPFGNENPDDENPYVEMTKNVEANLEANSDSTKSNYEIICIGTSFSNSSPGEICSSLMEPVYMELTHNNSNSSKKKNSSFEEQRQKKHGKNLNLLSGSNNNKSTSKKGTLKKNETKKKTKKSSSSSGCTLGNMSGKKKDLPDILKPSQSMILMAMQNSESSDADDESSRDNIVENDSLLSTTDRTENANTINREAEGESKVETHKKMCSRSRFSLSDTFRPASYYLGASTPLSNCAESSDSEIVSPPPIPSSPPPLEELKTEEIFSSENFDTVKRQQKQKQSGAKLNLSYEQISTAAKAHSSNSSLNSNKMESGDHKSKSRLSLPDQFQQLYQHQQQIPSQKHQRSTLSAVTETIFRKSLSNNSNLPVNLHKRSQYYQHERTLSDSNYSFYTDNSSNTSSDFDLYNKLKNSSPSFTGTGSGIDTGRRTSISTMYSGLPPSPCDNVNFFRKNHYTSNTSLTSLSGGAQRSPHSTVNLRVTPTLTDSSETESVELRYRQGSDSELEKQRSRRPLSEESISEIESMNDHFDDTAASADLDSYLNKLQTSNLYLYQSNVNTINSVNLIPPPTDNLPKNIELNNQVLWTNENKQNYLMKQQLKDEKHDEPVMNFIKPPEIFRNEGDDHFYGNINFVSSTDSLQKIGDETQPDSGLSEYINKNVVSDKTANTLFYGSSNANALEGSLLKEKNLSLHDAKYNAEDLNNASNFNIDLVKSITLSSIDMDQTSFCTAFDLTTQITPIHTRNNSNQSDQSAPYYYSDLSGAKNSNNVSNVVVNKETLNNQKDIKLRKNTTPTGLISHIHNPIGIGVSNNGGEGHASIPIEMLTDKEQNINSKNLYRIKSNNVDKNLTKEIKCNKAQKQNINGESGLVLDTMMMGSPTPLLMETSSGNPLTISPIQIVPPPPLPSIPTMSHTTQPLFLSPKTPNSLHSTSRISEKKNNNPNSSSSLLSFVDTTTNISSYSSPPNQETVKISPISSLKGGKSNITDNSSSKFCDISSFSLSPISSLPQSSANKNISGENSNDDSSYKEIIDEMNISDLTTGTTATTSTTTASTVVSVINRKSLNKNQNTNSSNEDSSGVVGRESSSGLSGHVDGEMLWDEDALWTESLRRVSQRHARSLDDLDRIPTAPALVAAVMANSSFTNAKNAKITNSSRNVNKTKINSNKMINKNKNNSNNSSPEDSKFPNRKSSSKLSRDVTYVNDNVTVANTISRYRSQQNEQSKTSKSTEMLKNQQQQHNDEIEQDDRDDNDVYVQLAVDDDKSSDVYEILREDTGSIYSKNRSDTTGSSEIDRETIRQWDSMSSGLMRNSSLIMGSSGGASISVQNVHNLPRTNLSIKPLVVGDSLENDQDHQGMMVSKVTDKMRTSSYYGNEAGSSLRGALGNRTLTEMDIRSNYNHDDYSYPPMMRKSGSRAEIDLLERETNSQIRNLDVSAGDLLSRTHEELVLLLIQLRRQNSTTARAIEQCCTEIHELQNRIRTMGGPSRSESIQRLDYLKQHLLDLERQYEKSKPLVNLVDNMVKLGSLYRNNENSASRYLQQNESVTLDRLEFNQRIQERRLLKEEQRHWDRVSPDHTELQSKVRQLYQLDQLLQEESGTLQNLQRDKEDLERALGGLKARLQDSNSHPVQMEAAKKQQHILERELSRVHQLLAENSKKLEQTVAGNARLEQELLVLRQKLQASRGSRGSQGVLSPSGGNMQNSNGGGDSITFASSTTALLESELKRVQQLVGDMQRQRQELSHAVRQLTENSNALYQQIGKNRELYTSYSSTTPLSSTTAVSTTPSSSTAGVNNSSVLGASHSKKRQNHPCWTETDLDSMISITHTKDNLIGNHNINTPLFVDTGSANSSANILNCSSSTNMNEYDTTSSKRNYNRYDAQDNLESRDSDNINIGGSLDNMDVDTMENNQFSNLSSQERQEIKTVRIVKRESERRQRDRERSMISSTQNLDQVQEEDVASSMSTNNKTIPDQRYNEQEQNGGYNRSKSQPRTYDSDSYDIYRQSFEKKMYNDYYQTSNVKSSNNSNPINSNSATHRYGIDDYGTTHSFYGSTGTNSSPTTTNPYPVTMSDNNSNITSAYSNYASVIKSKHPNPTTLSTNPFEQPQHVAQTAVYSSLKQKSDSIQSLTSPIFQSEAAKQIISEMSAGSASEDNTEKVPLAHKHRRAVPKEKRRHYTAPNNVNATAMENVQAENDMNRNNTNWKARDDLDMEIALRPRMNAPDIVKSALGQREKISENTIDKLLAAPSKILIPERYIPEKAPELSPEEKKRRQEKVESIKKMLSEAPMNTSNDTANLPSSKLNAEKKQREHLLQLNQILAQQVMQMSKIVAEKAMAALPSKIAELEATKFEEESFILGDSLPIYQQRENYYT